MQDKTLTHFTFNIWALQNPPSPNELLSKSYRFADIKASAHASHKTHACISLKQRGYSRNYGLVCNLGKQMADRQGFVLSVYGFVINNLRGVIIEMLPKKVSSF
jgi:hypothetical protein